MHSSSAWSARLGKTKGGRVASARGRHEGEGKVQVKGPKSVCARSDSVLCRHRTNLAQKSLGMSARKSSAHLDSLVDRAARDDVDDLRRLGVVRAVRRRTTSCAVRQRCCR